MPWGYTPTHFDGVDLTAAPFEDVDFRITELPNSPAYTRRDTPISAPIIGRGSQRVRGQPEPGTWVLGVLLDGATEAKVRTFKEVFSPDRGLVYLRADDGDAANWRVACAVVQIRAGAGPLSWQVELDIPNPTWEENAQDSQAAGATSGDSVTVNVTNAGNRALLPIVQIKPRSGKDTFVHDWKLSIRGFIVNRCPYWVTDKAMQLFSNSDGGDDYDTAAIVKSPIFTNLLDGAINDAVTTIDIDTPGGGGIFPFPAMALIGDGVQNAGAYEQIYYTANSGTQITGAVRGIGGSTAFAWDDATPIAASLMLASGDDLHVWLDGVRQEDVFIADIDTATTKVAVPITMPPMKAMTLRSAATAGAPADGADLEVLEDISDMESPGIVVIDDEAIAYQALDLRNRKFTTIERGAWGTTAAIHAVNATVYRCDHTYVIGIGYALANPPEAPLSRAPGCEINTLTPDKGSWGDEAAGPGTVFYDADNPDRPDTFHPDFEVAEDNRAEPLRLEDSSDKVEWKDSAPESGKPQAGRLVMATPFGIKAAAGAIVYDVQHNRDMRIRVLGRDAIGDKEIVLGNHWDIDEALVAQSLTPDATLQELILEGVRSGVVGNTLHADAGSGEYVNFDDVDEGFVIGFSLDQDTVFDSLVLNIGEAIGGSPDFTFTLWVLANDGTNPEDGTSLWRADYDDSVFGAVNTLIAFSLSNLQLGAGIYYLAGTMTAHVGGRIAVRKIFRKTKHSPWRADEGGGWDDAKTLRVPYFRFIQTGDSPIQPEMDLLNEDGVGDIDDLVLTWENPPQIRREATFGSALHHLNSVISNDGNARAFTLDCWVKDEATLEVDCDQQTAEWSDGYHVIRQPGAVDPVNDKEWLKLEPGAQIITHTEENMTNTEVTVLHRGLRV